MFLGPVLFQPNWFFLRIWTNPLNDPLQQMKINMFLYVCRKFSYQYLETFLPATTFLRVSFFRCLSQDFFPSESFLSNPFLIAFQDHFPQTSLSRSSVSRYTVRLQELFQKRFKSFKMNIIPSQYSISMLCCRKPYVENYPFHSFLLGNVGEARESKNVSSHKFFSIDFP